MDQRAHLCRNIRFGDNSLLGNTLPGGTDKHQKNARILLANLFQLTRLLFSHRMFQAFVPYKRPYARQNFRYFRVGQQYPRVKRDTTKDTFKDPHMQVKFSHLAISRNNVSSTR